MLYEVLFVPDGEKLFCKTFIHLPEISKYIEGWGLSDFGIIAQDGSGLIGAAWGILFPDFTYNLDRGNFLL